MGLWFQRHLAERPRARLVCFPHAGGVAGMFRSWPGGLPADIEVVAVQYPGRQDRLGERCVEDMRELADRVTAELLPYADLPLALFGHSMGSSVAYEVAARLQEEHGRPPCRLFVSGRCAPHAVAPSAHHLLDDDALIRHARSLGDYDSKAYDVEELRPLLVPSLRSDYTLIENYRPGIPTVLDAPISACGGDQDPACAADELPTWRELTKQEFEVRIFPGDHFYLQPGERHVLRYMSRRLMAVRRSPRP